jgi:hypothetical protein
MTASTVHVTNESDTPGSDGPKRRLLSLAEGDPHGIDGVATKGHRAGKFAEWLTATFGAEALKRGTGVLDVAGLYELSSVYPWLESACLQPLRIY